MRRGRKAFLCSLLGLAVYLTAESFVPPSAQPSAQVSLALIQAYQATGSKLMESGGVHCRYQPTCSHYAHDAIAYYGTVGGMARAAGRLWRCSPWGGTGYDPAVEDHSAAYVEPQQETPEQQKAREDAQKKAAEDFKKAAEEFNKMGQDFRKNMPEATGRAVGGCVGGCVGALAILLVHVVIMVAAMIYVWKDAKARGDSNAVLWMVLVFVFSWVGAVVYLLARPKGELSPCPACHKQRLSTLPVCPHCQAGAGPPPKTA